nr:cytochrome P450 [Agasicles hygrophila]
MLLYIIILLLSSLFLYVKWAQTYWQRKGIFHAEPTFLLGFMDSLIKGQHLCVPITEMYNKAKKTGNKYFGHYEFFKPVFTPIDLDLIKTILHTNFVNFDCHLELRVDEKLDPLEGHLFNLRGDKWKNVRAKITYAFTSGKLKMMCETMAACANNLEDLLDAHPKNKPIDTTDVFGRFTTDIIGTIGFGLDINSMKDPDAVFRNHGNKIFTLSFLKKIFLTLKQTLPIWLVKRIKISTIDPDTTKFFIDLTHKTVHYRETNNIYRKDFLHLLLQLKNFGKIMEDESVLVNSDNKNSAPGMTINEMAAQCFVFFAAGFHTSATTMTFALFELAQNKDLQDKARKEIREILKKHNNQLGYDALMEMEYLDQVLSETLRKYPPLAVVPRECTKDFKVPDSDLVIHKGQSVQIPVYSIQNDPEYFPHPEVFDPERFNNNNKGNIPAMAYLPFGDGPRICIGLRLGKLQTKFGICTILNKYEVTLHEKTKLPISFPTGPMLAVEGGVWLNIKEVK